MVHARTHLLLIRVSFMDLNVIYRQYQMNQLSAIIVNNLSNVKDTRITGMTLTSQQPKES
jgi:hypothetical protein